ncbi:MAG TPA: polysaccharide biosynthesis tyrosine autokinase [Pyrinomonadaceae bacterium]|jgi:capsular exopolysaccharide synthesis family protein|nr:polysaccharide biosynthesis tyrosine autokinase [Pyrinomonadaceae bacterium]
MNEATNLIKQDEAKSLERRADEGSYRGYGYGADAGEGEVHLLDYWRAIRKRLWLVIGVAVLITTLSIIYVARKPDIYEASSQVQVDLENNPMYAEKNGSMIFSPVNDPAYFNTQLQILTSPGLLRRVVRTLDLEHNQGFTRPQQSQGRSTWKTIVKMLGGSSGEKQGSAQTANVLPLSSTVAPAISSDDLVEAKRLAPYVGALQGGLRVEPVRENRAGYNKETRLIDISYQHGDPEVAAKIVNCVAQTFVRSNLEKKNEANTSTSEFLSRRVAELQTQIRDGEEKLVAYAKSNQMLSLDANQNTVVDRLSGLNKQLLEAENDRKLAEAEYNAAKAPGAAGALVEASAKEIEATNTELAKLRQKRAELLVSATEEAPEVKEIDGQIDSLQKHLADTRSRNTTTLLTNLETKYRQALDREEALRKSFNQQKGETVTQNEAAINYRILQQEIETNKGLLNNLLQRSKENDVVLAGRPNNISVVDYAIVPDFPVGPARLRTVIFAFMLALAFGAALALFLEYLDDTVHSTDDVERFLRLPALAVIPSMGAGSAPRRLLSTAAALQKRNGHNPELLLNVNGRSALAEAYRQLRTSVLLSTAGRAPKTLLVTSSLPGEGKTTTAVNTAISLAQTNASVVIIDGDMRRPRLRSIFDLRESDGLSSILSSETSDEDIMRTVVRDQESGLCILPSGPVPPNPAELLGSDQMRKLIGILSERFAHIVIDSPPINSFTDGVLIGSIVDGVLLVVHGGKSSRDVVRRSRQVLLDVGAKIVGVVLNNVSVRSHDYYYYQRYYHQSYYDSNEADSPRRGETATSA